MQCFWVSVQSVPRARGRPGTIFETECGRLGNVHVRTQLAAARLEQERLEAEARRVRDAAHNGHIAAIRTSLSGTKVAPN